MPAAPLFSSPLPLSSPSSIPQGPAIFALASGGGPLIQAIAVLRVSGGNSAGLLTALAGPLPEPRRAVLRRLTHRGEILDQALVLWMPAPRSYTGEDSFELHLHGSPAVIEAVSSALEDLGARAAERGEFSRRAVDRGRMDLLEAEAVADLIHAESAAQRRQALAQLGGHLGGLCQNWRERILGLLAHQEALIDFPDESLPLEIQTRTGSALQALLGEIKAHLASDRGEVIRSGFTIALAGAPNVGKSSLLNALAGEERAIVTAQAGTTRDPVSVEWIFEGMKIHLVDTAGLRETSDEIEREGIRRAKARMQSAQLVLHLRDCTDPHAPTDPALAGLPAEELWNKADLQPPPPGKTAISALGPEGVRPVLALLKERLRQYKTGGNNPPITRPRHRAALAETARALAAAASAPLPEIAGEELRLALEAIGRLMGKTDVEAVLDSVFGEFCIGK